MMGDTARARRQERRQRAAERDKEPPQERSQRNRPPTPPPPPAPPSPDRHRPEVKALFHAIDHGLNLAKGDLVGKDLNMPCDGDAPVLTSDLQTNAANDTLLSRAIRRGRADVVGMLLRARASVDQAMSTGEAPLYIASYLGHAEIVATLVAAGADVNVQTPDHGATALYVASGHGHADTVAVLAAGGAHMDLAANNRFTPLGIASQEGRAFAIEALIAGGADVDSRCLLTACAHGHLRCVQILSAHGAPRTMRGFDAEAVASQHGHTEVATWLAESRDWTSAEVATWLAESRDGTSAAASSHAAAAVT
jgi:ankyrin repeat protein